MNQTKRRSRPADPPIPAGYPPQFSPRSPKRPVDEDGMGSIASFLGVQPSAPVYVSVRARKRVGRMQILSVLGVLFLLGLWFYSRYRNMVLLAGSASAYPDDIPQEFRVSPSRYVQQRHSTLLPSNLPFYGFTSLSGWANGTFEIVAAEKDEDFIKFEVLIESPTTHISDLFIYDDSKAQDKGAIVMKLLDRVSPPKMSKWIKLHARLMLPAHQKYRTLKVQLFPELPYWYTISMDAIDGISFKTLELTTTHGDIEVKGLTASKSIIETQRGDVRHGQLSVPSDQLQMASGKGNVIPI